ncbi:acetate/propionate family kinase [Shimia sp. FJ5]|uniref:acetate/propionate family kinase n=1 Tax=Shimia sp. FJ5 TaxID=3079054 RepID=UPI002606C72E|nr:acetate/propionate family kinase [Shimia sp. FJ5]MDV4145732.1 acetate/propionate family kinase [Shimia sp. FJ5]
MRHILVVNAGSSSIKFAVFGPRLEEVLRGGAEEIGDAARLKINGESLAVEMPSHADALAAILSALKTRHIGLGDLGGIGHRVVHGGMKLTAPARVTPEVEAEIESCAALAPLHNPNALMVIRALRDVAPDIPQVAVFDTAFHATNPEVARRYAIPAAQDAAGMRRYGFHGISYASMVDALGADVPPRLLALHLGNGASLCAIRDGKSVATTMGYSPLDGLPMGTRAGSLDPIVALRLAREVGVTQAETILNKESGLLALGGTHDMAMLVPRKDEAARFAVDHFCYWAVRHAGSMVAAMGGLDAIAFTGGIGENADTIRKRIVEGLTFLGDVPVHVVPAQEERQIAKHCFQNITIPLRH